jgi:hypothetical protein
MSGELPTTPSGLTPTLQVMLITRQPGQYAERAEEHPRLPSADCERVSGYGVMGLPFLSGHVLGLRRWTASSVGEAFTSIWHRDPQGRWTFYETAPSDTACSRYFGADVDRVRVGPIALDWETTRRLHIRTLDDTAVDWTVELGSTPTTRVVSMIGTVLPAAAWRQRRLLSVLGPAAGTMLRAGRVQLTGMTSNGQHFDANPCRIWHVTASHARVEDEQLGPIGALAQQARMADFYFPQRGIFAIGRVFVTPPPGGNDLIEVGRLDGG